jgi:hypothetical protein
MKKAAIILVLVSVFLPIAAQAQSEKKLPDLGSSAVTIPWSDFKELIKDLIAPPPPPPPLPEPPVDYSVSTASYVGRLEGKNAVFSATFTLTILSQKKWVVVPLVADTLAVSDVSMDGVAVALSDRDGYHAIITDRPGKHTVTLKFFVSADTGSGRDSLNVPIPRVPATTLTFTVMQPGLEFEVAPAHYTKVVPAGGGTTVDAVLPITDSLAISWSPAVREEVSGALRVQAQVNTLLSVGEGIMKGVTTVTYEIAHGSLSSFTVVVPASIEIIDVQGDAVRDWKTTPDKDRVAVTVNAKFEVSGKTSIVLLYEKNMGGTTADLEVPEIEVKDVARETGYLAVTSSTKVGVEQKDSKNLANLDMSELPTDLVSASENPILFSYKYIKHPYSLKLAVVTYEDMASLTTVVTKADLSSLLTIRGDLVTRAVFTIKNNVKQFMRLTLPKDSTLWSAYVSDRPVKPSADKDGTVLIPLDRSTRSDTTLTSFRVEIVYITRTRRLLPFLGSREFACPVTDIQTDALSWTLYLPQKFAYRSIGRDMEEIVPVSTAPTGYGVGMETNAPAALPNEEMKVSDEMYGREAREPESQVMFEKNIYAEGLSSIGGTTGMKGVLPVRLDIPFSGHSIGFTKAIVKPGEKSTVKIRYEGRSVSTFLSYLSTALFAVMFICLIITARGSIGLRRFAIDRGVALVFGVSLAVIILISIFLIVDVGSVWWGIFIALVVGVFLFAKDIVPRLRGMIEHAQEERVKRQRERSRVERKNEK